MSDLTFTLPATWQGVILALGNGEAVHLDDRATFDTTILSQVERATFSARLKAWADEISPGGLG